MPDEFINEVNAEANKLLNKLQTLAWSAGVKYEYYNATQVVVDLGISVPKKFKNMQIH